MSILPNSLIKLLLTPLWLVPFLGPSAPDPLQEEIDNLENHLREKERRQRSLLRASLNKVMFSLGLAKDEKKVIAHLKARIAQLRRVRDYQIQPRFSLLA